MTERKYRYHIFLSHNGAQKEWTRRLADRLRQKGLSVFFDEDSIRLGDDIPTAVETGLKSSRHVVLVLSPEALESKWVALEYSASLYKDPSAADRTLIPVLRKDCDIPLILARLKYLDARSEDVEKQVGHLLNGIERVEIDQPDQAPVKRGTSSPRLDSQERLTVTMPVPAESGALYVERAADLAVRRAIETNQIAVIFGPRMIGKTSLIYHACAFAEAMGRPVGFVDFQMSHSGTSLPQVYYSMAVQLSQKTGIEKPNAEEFLSSPALAAIDYFHHLRPNTVLAFDECDALRGINALEDFSHMIRGFWHQQAFDRSRNVAVLLSSWLPPFRFIENSLSSPFNIGYHVRLEPFDRTETEHLIRRALPGLPARDADNLYDLVGGQPRLLQQALSRIVEGASVTDLRQEAVTVFGSYLEFLRVSLSVDTRCCVEEGGLNNLDTTCLAELEATGLIIERNHRYEFACRLYEMAFSKGHNDNGIV
jgi:hypothetical protein